jgi:serine/threonine protein kinase
MRKSPPLHPLFVRELIEQIAKGLFNLKQNHLIHRDFKTENILLGANF